MKAYSYFAFGISIIFTVMGILVLSGSFGSAEFFRGNEVLKYLFGSILIIYGIFRAYSAYSRMKNSDRKFHYYDPNS